VSVIDTYPDAASETGTYGFVSRADVNIFSGGDLTMGQSSRRAKARSRSGH